MAEHSYHQYCPVAHALDLIGDRWTLLILRNLLVGPKRFVDLQTGLPGLGTNILTTRLKGLEHSGVVHRRFLPPPAASMVYELTEYGRQIEEPLSALARWGAQSLGALTPEQVITADAVMMALHGLFRGEQRQSGQAIYEIRCEDERFHDVFHIQINGNTVEVAQGAVATPDVVMYLNVETLYALSSRRVSLSVALANNTVSLKGNPQAITHFMNRMDEQVHTME